MPNMMATAETIADFTTPEKGFVLNSNSEIENTKLSIIIL
jgi:hypothetical protein